jgi:hypothetical protein
MKRPLPTTFRSLQTEESADNGALYVEFASLELIVETFNFGIAYNARREKIKLFHVIVSATNFIKYTLLKLSEWSLLR